MCTNILLKNYFRTLRYPADKFSWKTFSPLPLPYLLLKTGSVKLTPKLIKFYKTSVLTEFRICRQRIGAHKIIIII